MEASIEGINSIGFSLTDFSHKADMQAAKAQVKKIMSDILDSQLDKGILLNVNIPAIPTDEIKGIKVCRQAKGNWVERFLENKDPRGQAYYWLAGDFITTDTKNDTDLWALKNGYISVVPSQHDLTNYPIMEEIKFLES